MPAKSRRPARSIPQTAPRRRPKPSQIRPPLLLGETLVDDERYPLYLNGGGFRSITVPGVAGDEQTAPIAERVIPFEGHGIPIQLALKEANAITDHPVLGQIVIGVCQYAITMNGALVYTSNHPLRSIEQALTEAAYAVHKLRQSPIAWWATESLVGHPVVYQGTRCHISSFDPSRGMVVLESDENEPYGHTGSVAVDIVLGRLPIDWLPDFPPAGKKQGEA